MYHKLGSYYRHPWAALLSGHCFACTNTGGRGRRDQLGATLVGALPMAIQIQLRVDGLGWMGIL